MIIVAKDIYLEKYNILTTIIMLYIYIIFIALNLINKHIIIFIIIFIY